MNVKVICPAHGIVWEGDPTDPSLEKPPPTECPVDGCDEELLS